MADGGVKRRLTWPLRLVFGLALAIAGLLLIAAVAAPAGEMNCDAPGPACQRAKADFEEREDREMLVFGASGAGLIVVVLLAWSRLPSGRGSPEAARAGDPRRRA